MNDHARKCTICGHPLSGPVERAEGKCCLCTDVIEGQRKARDLYFARPVGQSWGDYHGEGVRDDV